MLPAAFVKGYNRRRLRLLLGGLFLALALPTAAVIWQAYDRLQFEAWYQYRNQAEQLARQIDTTLQNRMAAAEARSFADFSFISATSASNVLQRSPLSAFPVRQDIPGALGHFQLDPAGRFSTPLVPPQAGSPEQYGLTAEEFAQRLESAAELQRILTDNALVDARATAGGRQSGPPAEAVAEEEGSADFAMLSVDAGLESAPASPREAETEPPLREATEFYFEQEAFDQLNEPVMLPQSDASRSGEFAEPTAAPDQAGNFGKVEDLALDDALQRKDESQKRQSLDRNESKESDAVTENRLRRVEKSVQASSRSPALDEFDSPAPAITTFESEIDPYQFSMLGSGHLVLFRNAWRDGSRFIQGLLIDRTEFTGSMIEAGFRDADLYRMSDLVVGYRDDVVDVIRGRYYEGRIRSQGAFEGTLLYRTSLSAPFDELELIFSIARLPAGPGAAVLGWTTLVIAIVFAAGFVALYRLGLSQIRLARQQQDFVSAVSHELKTPLTSIRMYGEMLREGWASEEKQKQYYEFIHDESERLSRLISNVLQLARITRSEPQFDSRNFSAGELIDLVRSKISNQVERAGFELSISGADADTTMAADVDADCFSQIMINLVDNAIKFSRDAEIRRIEVRAERTGNDELVFSVRDFGPGIEKGQLRKIFRLFYRSESELTRETVGTGIGLAIVHQLTTLMNGSVDVINRDPGAEFRVSFPNVQKRNV